MNEENSKFIVCILDENECVKGEFYVSEEMARWLTRDDVQQYLIGLYNSTKKIKRNARKKRI